jgi:hypothetical protein
MSIRARGSDELRTPAKKGPAAEIAAGAYSRGGWGARLNPAHCHSCADRGKSRPAGCRNGWSAIGIGVRPSASAACRIFPFQRASRIEP